MSNDDGSGMPFDLGALMNKARELQQNMQQAKDDAESVRVQGDAGGGMVVAEANGNGTILRISIEPELIKGGDKEMIEDLTVAAVNQAVSKSKQAMQDALKSATGGLPLPMDLDKLV